MSALDLVKLKALFPNGNLVSINYLSLFSYARVHVLHIEVIRKQNIFSFWLETLLVKHCQSQVI